ncbi:MULTISPECIES: branched-chain amino acid ABC transporter permease [Paenibacillus]|uniref:ABC transporter n=1 Tax=Paenibacillus naphthalenovorans TaxID=162209 RepID=A0A0U2U6K6_9BACL|nr:MULTISPECIES: branched-chain amino acid ABC transporter permease [Paenibacillus]ALS21832.1 ABC transporter [Paenibacillus naphthalenovorans]
MKKQTLYASRLKPLFILMVLIVLAPVLFHSPYYLTVLVLIGIYSIITLGLSLLMGYAGQISLGHAAFFGIGAYTSGILTVKYGVAPLVAMLAGILLTGLIAFAVGIPTLKLKEHFLALATIGFNIIVYIVILGMYDLTGGASGLTGIPKFSVFGFDIRGEWNYYFLVWGIVLLLASFCINLVQSHIGRVLRGIHDSEIATLTQGIDVLKYKLQIFVLSAVFASAAGSLYAHFMNFLAPGTFYVLASIQLLIMVVVGGAQPIWGAILGAFVMTVLAEGVRHYVPMVMDVGGEIEIIIYGLLLVLVMMFMPKGLLPMIGAIQERFRRRKLPEGGGPHGQRTVGS